MGRRMGMVVGGWGMVKRKNLYLCRRNENEKEHTAYGI
jgi:hypothetical protein